MNSAEIEDRMDKIYDTIDELLLSGKFDECESVLKKLNVQNMPIAELLGYLTITLQFNTRLPYRQKFYANVKEEIIRREGDERLKGLLKGLKDPFDLSLY